MHKLLAGIALCLWCPFALTAPDSQHALSLFFLTDLDSEYHLSEQLLLLADKTRENEHEPEPGSLVIPGDAEEKADKQCLTICKKWGEDCIINPRTGDRNCRRTCKDFGQECF
jgi:hypothetical protein